MLEPGRVLGAKYRLEREIGRGGMGSVWRATRLDLGTELAIKVMHGGAANPSSSIERFSQEARAAASLTNPHVVRIIDFGIDREAKTAFIAMELLEGDSLAARLVSQGRLAPEHVASIIRQVSRALGQAHDAGIVHRDLKPANVFLVRNADDELVKLLDFGIAKAADGMSTVTGSVLGTPHYMSPEQVNSQKDIDHRTDLWSLGVIACECLTGRRPFNADTLSELAMKIVLGRAEVPSRLAPVPAGFDAWFARATMVDASQRFQSAAELASTLAEVLRASTGSAGMQSGVVLAKALAASERAEPPGPTRSSGAASSSGGGGPWHDERSQPALARTEISSPPDDALSTTSATAVPRARTSPRVGRRWLVTIAVMGLAVLGVRVFAAKQVPSTDHASAPAATSVSNEAASPVAEVSTRAPEPPATTPEPPAPTPEPPSTAPAASVATSPGPPPPPRAQTPRPGRASAARHERRSPAPVSVTRVERPHPPAAIDPYDLQ